MRRLPLLVGILVLVMMVPVLPIGNNNTSTTLETSSQHPETNRFAESEAVGTGTTSTSEMYFSRSLYDQQLTILNSFSSPDTHQEVLDLSVYQVPGWTLYKVVMDIANTTAVEEREVLGVTHGTDLFRIYKDSFPFFVTKLAQGFYNQSHDGSLLNYSIRYRASDIAEPQYYGYAYSTIRSDVDTDSSNITTYVNLTESTPYIWKSFNANSAELNASTVYWAMIDGSNLIEYAIDDYPIIRWSSENSAGDFTTRRYIDDFSSWQEEPTINYEALMNYTYTPWNKSTASALVFDDPTTISYQANTTALTTMMSWEFTSTTKNITSITFDTNQSVYTYHNMTLWYTRDVTASNSWYIPTSGASVEWSSSQLLTYPVLSGTMSRFLNTSKMSDWTPSGLYNGTSTLNYGNWVAYTDTVTCSLMTNGTWKLNSTADNYVDTINTLDSSDSSVLTTNVNVLTDVDVISLIKDTGGQNATSGSTNFTVWQDTNVVWAASPNQAVINGNTQYLWDVSLRTPDNVKYRLEVFWTNGTEAGYLTKEMVVWYPTTLIEQQSSISAFSENNFELRADFVETFQPSGLDSVNASVICSLSGGYSFDFSQPMIDGNGNGTWTRTISTAGWYPGTYTIDIDGQGFALQNQTTSVTVMILHETQPLLYEWVSVNSITYVESTMLNVTYHNATGSFNAIPDAWVNVTDGTDFWNLTWDPLTESYKLTFNGSDPLTGIGVHSLTLSAWKAGYQSKANSTTLTIIIDPATVSWTDPLAIDWTQQTVLSIDYEDSYGTPISNPDQKLVYVDGAPYTLSGSAGTYSLLINNTWDLGVHVVTFNITKFGYANGEGVSSFTINEAITELNLEWSFTTIDYVGQIDLTANYSYLGSGLAVSVSPLTNANISIDGGPQTPLNPSGNLWTANLTGVFLDLGVHNVIIRFWEYGYIYRQQLTVLTVDNVTTSLSVEWSSIVMDYVGQIDLTANYSSDSTGLAVPAPTQYEISIDGGIPFALTQSGPLWIANLTNVELDLGVHNILISFWRYGYVDQNQSAVLTVNNVTTSLSVVWSSIVMDYIGQIDLTANYSSDSTGLAVPAPTQYEISIDGGIPFALTQSGPLWIENLTNIELDLGIHNIEIRFWKYGYDYQEHLAVLTVNNVSTTLTVTWSPTNVTIDFTESLDVVVEYTYGGGDVPSAGTSVNVSINGHLAELSYSAGAWRGTFLGSVLDVGVYNANVDAWLYGYEWRTNITYDINVTQAANLFWVEWNPGTDITYIETLEVFVNYTYEYSPVIGATINVTFDGSFFYDLLYNATSERYEISIPGYDIDIGTWNATVRAWKDGYNAGIDYELITINVDIPVLTPSWFANSTDYVTPLSVTVTVTASNLSLLVGCTVDIEVSGQLGTGTSIADGIYESTLGPLLDLGVQVVNVTVSKHGYETTTILLTVTVSETITQITITPGDSVRYYDGILNVDIYYEMLNGTHIGAANVELFVNGSSESVTSAADRWQALLRGVDLGIGVFICQVNVSLYGYVDRTDVFTVTIEAIPVSIEVIGPTQMYVNDSIELGITFEDDRTSSPIFIDNSYIAFEDGIYAIETEQIGQYTLLLNSSGMHVGTYELNLVLEKLGYLNATYQVDIDVNPVPTEILFEHAEFNQYENETVVISVQLNDTYHNSFIDWANVILYFERGAFSMTYVGATQSYQASIFLDGALVPDEYDITVTANATDCESAERTTTLTINSKILYNITVTVDEPVIAGVNLNVAVIVSHSVQSVLGLDVTFHVMFVHQDNSTTTQVLSDTTLADGTAERTFDVPSDAIEVMVWVEFTGSESEWPIITASSVVVVNPPTSLLDLILQYLQVREIQFLLMFLIVAGVVGAYYSRKVKPKRRAKTYGLERQLAEFQSLTSVGHFMAVYLDRGTCVFYHPFTEARIQPDLISGFIAAITSVYGEIKGDGVQGTLEEIHYHGLRLNSYSGKYIVGILILEGDMTPLLRERLQFFVEMFEAQYETDLEGWVGVIDCFDPEWIVSNLNSTLDYHWHIPHRITVKMKLKGISKRMVDVIEQYMDEMDEFYLARVIQPMAEEFGCTEAEALDMIYALADKGVINPISVHTVLLRQGFGLAGDPDHEMEFILEDHELSRKGEDKPSDDVESAVETEAEVVETPEEVDEPEQPETEPEEESDSRDDFVSDVEAILKDEKPDEDAVDPMEEFVSDVEQFLKKKKDEDNDK